MTTVPSVEDTGDESPGDSKEELGLDEEIMRLAESSEEDSSDAISNEDVDKPEARDSQEQQSNDFAQHPFDDQPDSETEESLSGEPEGQSDSVESGSQEGSQESFGKDSSTTVLVLGMTTVPSVEDTGDESPGDSKEELSLDEEIMRLAESSEEDSSDAISNEDVDKPEARDSQEQQSKGIEDIANNKFNRVNEFAQHPFDDQPDSESHESSEGSESQERSDEKLEGEHG